MNSRNLFVKIRLGTVRRGLLGSVQSDNRIWCFHHGKSWEIACGVMKWISKMLRGALASGESSCGWTTWGTKQWINSSRGRNPSSGLSSPLMIWGLRTYYMLYTKHRIFGQVSLGQNSEQKCRTFSSGVWKIATLVYFCRAKTVDRAYDIWCASINKWITASSPQASKLLLSSTTTLHFWRKEERKKGQRRCSSVF